MVLYHMKYTYAGFWDFHRVALSNSFPQNQCVGRGIYDEKNAML